MSIPTTDHWAVITTRYTHIPADARSISHPGHGYPEHTEESIDYSSFTSEAGMLAYIDQRNLAGKCVIIKAQPLKLTVTTTVAVK